jgi:hypothetical protein
MPGSTAGDPAAADFYYGLGSRYSDFAATWIAALE